MGVVRTDKWLRIYCQKWRKVDSLSEKMSLHRQVMIEPLSDIFETKNTKALQQFLFQAGLVRPDVSIDLEVEQLMDRSPWIETQKQLTYLQKKWTGPDVKLYLLPVEKRHSFLMKELGGKMGITLPKAIILFIHSRLTKRELQALVTHEYHHICRLMHTKLTEKSMTLLESMVMEGLAELAVREEIGADVNAAWTSYYDQRWIHDWFNRWIRPNLFLKDRKKHQDYLYGNEQEKVPLWLGYYIGYQLVHSAAKDTDKTSTLLDESAEALFERSIFFEKKGRN